MIVSRKFTQLANIQTTTAYKYIDEIEAKYTPGTNPLPSTPTNVKNGVAGTTLDGEKFLEVPPQAAAIPADVLQHAQNAKVHIIDTTGHVYI